MKTRRLLIFFAALISVLVLSTVTAAAADEITEISSADDWNAFAESVNSGNTYEGKTVTLKAEKISVTTMVGAEDHPFRGRFDGGGHTLEVNISGGVGEDYAAPFRRAEDSAEIKDLIVTGTINTSGQFAGGIIGHAAGSYYDTEAVRINNCRSSVTINSTTNGDGTHGGLVGRNGLQGENHELIITGCVFDGKLLGENTDSSAGFVGYDHLVCHIYDSLFIPADVTFGNGHSDTFMRVAVNDSPSLKNCYYTEAFGSAVNSTHVHKINTAEHITLASPEKSYGVSGLDLIKGPAVRYNNGYYSPSGSTVSVEYNGEVTDGTAVVFKITGAETGEAEKVKAVEGKASFRMPDEEVAITTEEVPLYDIGYGDLENGFFELDKEEAIEGEEVTVTPEPDKGYTSKDVKLLVETRAEIDRIDAGADGKYRFTMPAEKVYLSISYRKVPLVTEINNASNWSEFVDSLELGGDYSEKTVILNNDISITEMAGTEKNPFNGTFDGCRNTITCNIDGGSGEGTAPFRYIEDAEIRDVKTAGTVKGGNHTSGLVGFAWAGGNVIRDCSVMAHVTSGSYAGGIVGHSKTSHITIEGCLLGGRISGYTRFAAGFVGWTDGSVISIKNSLAAQSRDGRGQYHPIAAKNQNAPVTISVENTYYDGDEPEIGEDSIAFVTKAVKAHLVQLGENIKIKGEPKDYHVSGITAMGQAISLEGGLDSSLFSGEGQTLEFEYKLKTGEHEAPQYTVNGEKLRAGVSAYTMKNEPITVSVEAVEAYKVESGEVTGGTITPDVEYAEPGDRVTLDPEASEGMTEEGMTISVKYMEGGEEKTAELSQDVSGTYGFTMPKADVTVTGEFTDLASVKEIASEADWNRFADTLSRGADYSGKEVRLVNDITVTTMAGTEEHPFKGAFNGCGKTISVDITSDGDYVAPFRFTSGAAINNLTVTGTIRTSDRFAGGFIGWAKSYITIKNSCSDVKIISSVEGDGTHGGFIARQGDDKDRGAIIIEGSTVTGSMVMSEDTEYVTTNCGGFIGYGYSNLANFNNCAYAPSGNDGYITYGCETFIRQGAQSRMSTSGLFACTEDLGGRQNASLAYKLTAGDNTEIITDESEYSVTGITEKSFVKKGQLYYDNGEEVTVSYTGTPEDDEMVLFTVNGKTITGSSFKMPSEDTTVTAAAVKSCKVSFSANGGSGEMAPETVPRDAGYKLPSCAFGAPDEDMNFAGWQVGNDTANIRKAGEVIDLSGDTTLTAVWQVYRTRISLIDENGKEKTVTAINMTLWDDEDEENIFLGEVGETTWYYADEDFTTDKTLDLYGNVNIVLKDGVTIRTPQLWADENTCIFGQKAGTGKLITDKVWANERGAVSFNGGNVSTGSIEADKTSVYVRNGSLSVSRQEGRTAVSCWELHISGGKVDITSDAAGTEGTGIDAACVDVNVITEITGGTVNVHLALSEEEAHKDHPEVYMSAVTCHKIYVLGGNVTAEADEYKGASPSVSCYGLNAAGEMILGWTNASDSITATGYLVDGGPLKIADRKSLTDGVNVYKGELSSEEIAKIAGKTLTPEGVIKELKATLETPACGASASAPEVILDDTEGAALSGPSFWAETASSDKAFTGKFAGGKDYYAVFTIEADEQHLIGGSDFVTVNGEKPESVTLNGQKARIAAKVTVQHEIEKVEETEADCQNTGIREHFACKGCGTLFADAGGETEVEAEDLEIPVNGDRHTSIARRTDNDAAATCTAVGGYDVVVYCDDCGAVISKEHVVRPRLSHKWGEWEVTKAPTETQEGEEKRTCENDPSHVETRVIPVTGHEHRLTKVLARAASCEQDGNIEYYVCDHGEHPCMRYFADEGGTQELTQDEITVYAAGHIWGAEVKENETAATCTSPAAYEGVVYCTKCSKELSRVKKTEGSALGHKWSGWTVTKAPTETQEGEEQRVCEHDPSHVEKRSIPVISHMHVLVKVEAKKATCTEDGNIEYYVCSGGNTPCGKFFEDESGLKPLTAEETVVKASGHKWGAPVYEWSADNSEVTASRVCQNDPEHKEAETVKTTSEVTKEATSEAEGEMKYTAAFKNTAFETQTKTEIIPKNDPEPADRSKQKGADGTWFGKGASLEAAEAALARMKSDNDPAGTKFAPLKVKSIKQTKKTVRLTWKTAKGAVKYIVYGNKCGKTKKLTKLVTLGSSKRAYTVKKAAGKKLKKATYYKFIVIAVDADNNIVSSSRIAHVATAGSRKAGNPKKVVVKARVSKTGKKLKKYKATSAIAVKKGKTAVLKATFTKAKKTKVKKHLGIRYESSNTSVVTVTKKGKVKGVRKGTARIYAYAQNGVVKAVKVKVR